MSSNLQKGYYPTLILNTLVYNFKWLFDVVCVSLNLKIWEKKIFVAYTYVSVAKLTYLLVVLKYESNEWNEFTLWFPHHSSVCLVYLLCTHICKKFFEIVTEH